MLLRNRACYTLWQTHHILSTATRLLYTGISKELKMPLQMSDVSLTIRSVRVPVGTSFANVGYADLGCADGAVCLALHGAPGSVEDMVDLAPALTEAGFRLLIPEFPGSECPL